LRGVSLPRAIYFLLAAAPWVAGACAGWLAGDPTVAHVILILAVGLLAPLAWLGTVATWQRIFWERVSTGHVSTSGPIYEYRRRRH
jgi:hypothetical protein